MHLKRKVYLLIVFLSSILQKGVVLIINSLFTFKIRKKILVYSDSRGHEVTRPWNKHNPFSSYVKKLFLKYDVDYCLCPEFSTTFIDFLYWYKKRVNKGIRYDMVIAHLGLVDFSPRPVSMLREMIEAKKHKIEYLGLDVNEFKSQLDNDFGYEYFGEKTNNFYTKSFFERSIIPKLKDIDGIIFIGCNPILLNWNGNYWRKRPENINIIMDYNAVLLREFPSSVVDISDWNELEIKKYTVDNIHLNRHGYTVISRQLDNIISLRDSVHVN